MPTTDGSALARNTDPDTSRAAVPGRQRREEQKNAIIYLLTELGPMTDHQLAHEYKTRRAQHNWPATQLDSVRKRRGELKNEGRVVNTGRVSGWNAGPSCIVWGIAAAQEAAAQLGGAARVVAGLHHVSGVHLADLSHALDCDVLLCGDDAAAKQQAGALIEQLGARALDAGPLCNAVALESLTPVLLYLNRRYKGDGAGIRITGLGGA